MSTTDTRNPAPAVGQTVHYDRPDSWATGTVVAVAPERTILGHDGRKVVWGDSTTHLTVTIRWSEGSHYTDGEVSTVSCGHSFAGTILDTNSGGGWPAGWTVTP